MARKNKKRNLLLLLLVLVICSGGYAALRQLNEEAEESETTEAQEKEALISLSGDVSALSYEREGESVSLVLRDDAWQREGMADFPVDGSTVDSMVSNLTGAAVSQVINEDGSNLAEYGLEHPSFTVKAEDSEGNQVTVLIGDENSVAGGCYAMVEGSSQVVLTDAILATAFNYGWYDLASVDAAPEIDESGLKTITVTQGETATVLEYDEEGKADVDATGQCKLFLRTDDGYQAISSDWEEDILGDVEKFAYSKLVAYDPSSEEKASYGLEDPAAVVVCHYTTEETLEEEAQEQTSEASAEDTQEQTSEAGAEDIQEQTSEASAEDTQEQTSEASAEDTQEQTSEASAEETSENSTEESSEPKTVLVEHTYTLYIGNYDETQECYYVTHDDGTSVFAMDGELLESLLGLEPEKMIRLDPCNISRDTVDSLEVTYQGVTHTYTVETSREETQESGTQDAAEESESQESETAAGESEETTAAEAETVTSYKLDGEEIEAADFTDAYEAVSALAGARVLQEGEAVSGEAEFTVVFHRNTQELSTVKVAFLPYNENYYQVAVNDGEPSMVVNIRDVQSVEKLLFGTE